MSRPLFKRRTKKRALGPVWPDGPMFSHVLPPSDEKAWPIPSYADMLFYV